MPVSGVFILEFQDIDSEGFEPRFLQSESTRTHWFSACATTVIQMSCLSCSTLSDLPGVLILTGTELFGLCLSHDTSSCF